MTPRPRARSQSTEVVTLPASSVSTLASSTPPALSDADLSSTFGMTKRLPGESYVDTLARLRSDRELLADLVFDDHLRLIDHMIDLLAVKVDAADVEAIAETRKLLAERARLLNLYPVAREVDRSVNQNVFYLDFGGSVR